MSCPRLSLSKPVTLECGQRGEGTCDVIISFLLTKPTSLKHTAISFFSTPFSTVGHIPLFESSPKTGTSNPSRARDIIPLGSRQPQEKPSPPLSIKRDHILSDVLIHRQGLRWQQKQHGGVCRPGPRCLPRASRIGPPFGEAIPAQGDGRVSRDGGVSQLSSVAYFLRQ